jgi:RecJ-like exonuclease
MRRFLRSYYLSAFGMALASFVVMGLGGCTAEPGAVTGAATSGSPSTIGEPMSGDAEIVCTQCLKDEGNVGKTVTIEGEVIQQCPASGCWFRIKDGSGEAFIDLAPAKLSVQGERVGQHVKVTGKLVKKGGQVRVEAQHVEFSPAKKDSPPADKN